MGSLESFGSVTDIHRRTLLNLEELVCERRVYIIDLTLPPKTAGLSHRHLETPCRLPHHNEQAPCSVTLPSPIEI